MQKLLLISEKFGSVGRAGLNLDSYCLTVGDRRERERAVLGRVNRGKRRGEERRPAKAVQRCNNEGLTLTSFKLPYDFLASFLADAASVKELVMGTTGTVLSSISRSF